MADQYEQDVIAWLDMLMAREFMGLYPSSMRLLEQYIVRSVKEIVYEDTDD